MNPAARCRRRRSGVGRAGLVAATIALFPGCGSGGTRTAPCQPTATDAVPAARLDPGAPTRSSTLEARITAGGHPVGWLRLRFEVRDDDRSGATEYEGEALSDADGRARVDLKQLDGHAVSALAHGDSFRAAFGGTTRYCPSADVAPFEAAPGVAWPRQQRTWWAGPGGPKPGADGSARPAFPLPAVSRPALVPHGALDELELNVWGCPAGLAVPHRPDGGGGERAAVGGRAEAERSSAPRVAMGAGLANGGRNRVIGPEGRMVCPSKEEG